MYRARADLPASLPVGDNTRTQSQRVWELYRAFEMAHLVVSAACKVCCNACRFSISQTHLYLTRVINSNIKRDPT